MQNTAQIEKIQEFLDLVGIMESFGSIEDNIIIEKLSPSTREIYLSDRPEDKMISDKYFESIEKYNDIFKSLDKNNIENRIDAFLEFAQVYKEFGDIKDGRLIEKLSPDAREAYLENRPYDKEIIEKYLDIKERYGDILESEKHEFDVEISEKENEFNEMDFENDYYDYGDLEVD